MDRGVIAQFLRVFRLAYNRGLVSGAEGNGSVKTEEGIYITRSGASKGLMEPEDVILIDEKGNVLEGSGEPSSELPLHLKLYETLPDLGAIVHAHPPFSTAYTILEERFPLEALAEIFIATRGVSLVPYAPPSSEELAVLVADAASESDIFLLMRHGVVSIGGSLLEAYTRLEALEATIRVMMIARSAGNISYLKKEEIEELKKVREKFFES